jgi:hypothetical protein
VVTGSTGARIIIIFGWAVSLLVLSALQPAAWACPILIKQSAMLASEFVFSQIKNNQGGCAQEEQTQPATANNRSPLFNVGAADFGIADDAGPGGMSPQYAAIITGFGLNDATRSGHGPLQHRTNDEEYANAHDIAVAMYYAIYDIDSDVADDLLTSYHTISRVRGDIISAIEGPFNPIGTPSDRSVTQVDAGSAALTATNDRYDDSLHASEINQIIMRIRFLFSLDALPYYMMISGVYLIFVVVRAAIRMRHSVRSSRRSW